MLRKGASLFVLSALAVVSQAATLLTPGSAILVPDEEYVTGGAVLATRFEAFAITNALSEVRATGTVGSQVVLDADGFLTFLYVITNDASSIDEISRATMTDFGAFTTWVAQDLINSFGPQKATSADRSIPGGTIGFEFLNGPLGLGSIAPGESSTVLWIHTNATAYRDGTVSVINGGVDSVLSFAPVVPEPASLATLAIGAAALLRRRAKKA